MAQVWSERTVVQLRLCRLSFIPVFFERVPRARRARCPAPRRPSPPPGSRPAAGTEAERGDEAGFKDEQQRRSSVCIVLSSNTSALYKTSNLSVLWSTIPQYWSRFPYRCCFLLWLAPKLETGSSCVDYNVRLVNANRFNRSTCRSLIDLLQDHIKTKAGNRHVLFKMSHLIGWPHLSQM